MTAAPAPREGFWISIQAPVRSVSFTYSEVCFSPQLAEMVDTRLLVTKPHGAPFDNLLPEIEHNAVKTSGVGPMPPCVCEKQCWAHAT